jgi:NDP-hexose-3-ketoreductase
MPVNPARKIKVGVMGYANIADRSLIPAFLAHPNFSLVAIASRDKSKANRAAEKFQCLGIHGYESLLSADIDLVYIPLPTGLHEEWVGKCLKVGKHVFVEKSFGMSQQSTDALLELARQSKLIAMENFMFPYHSQHQYLMNLLAQNQIGDIRNFRATFCFPPLANDNFRYQVDVGGGALLDAAAYTTKAAQLILGPELDFMSASLHCDAVSKVDIYGAANFVYKNAVPVNLAWGFDNYYQCGVEILGSTGRILTKRSFTAGIGVEPVVQLESNGAIKEIQLPGDNHFHNILDVLSERIYSGDYHTGIEEIGRQSMLLEIIGVGAKRYEI